MTALPADIARFTTDGVVLTTNRTTGQAIRALHADARDSGTGEIEMFFDNAADAQALLDERFAVLSAVAPPHEGVEVADDLGLGSVIPLVPAVPEFQLVDTTRRLDLPARVRAFARDWDTDRYSVELLGY